MRSPELSLVRFVQPSSSDRRGSVSRIPSLLSMATICRLPIKGGHSTSCVSLTNEDVNTSWRYVQYFSSASVYYVNFLPLGVFSSGIDVRCIPWPRRVVVRLESTSPVFLYFLHSPVAADVPSAQTALRSRQVLVSRPDLPRRYWLYKRGHSGGKCTYLARPRRCF